MKKYFLSLVVLFSIFVQAGQIDQGQQKNFPVGPDPKLTPGSLCRKASNQNYGFAYCERDVSHGEKVAVIEIYDRQLGFHVQQMKRNDFKIDHFIPLCLGGSNETDNLWPQHESIYNVTDPLENVLCNKLRAHQLTQSQAIDLIKQAKLNLDQALKIIKSLF